MYAVSDEFLEAVAANIRSYYWAGTITTTAGKVYEFGYSDILKGSGYISSQCCGSTEIELGTVYSSELGITLLSEVDRYTLEDAVVETSEGTGSTAGWGLLKAYQSGRNGWISLDHAVRV